LAFGSCILISFFFYPSPNVIHFHHDDAIKQIINHLKLKNMKNSIYVLLALALGFLIVSACNKYGDLTGLKGKLVASKTTVKINEPDSLLLVGAKTTDSIHWSVSPAGFDTLTTLHNKARVVFTRSGNYTVTVTDNGTPASVSIKVTDSLYYPITTYNTIPLTGDTITLVPHYYKSPIADSTYLSFVAQTKKYYCSNSSLKVSYSSTNNNYAINFLNVVQPSPCTLGETPIAAVISFTANQPAPLPNGTFPLAVTLNGTTYTGSIVVTSATITFNWNYTGGGVLISPKQISR
jgi:hypothetical protein